jgi:hypothetical protein
MPEPTDLSAAVRALSAGERAAAGDHPSVEELTAYSEGTLPAARAEAVLAHAAVCRECSALLLEYAEFAPEPAGNPAQAAEVATAYRRTAERLGLRQEVLEFRATHRSRALMPWLLAAAGLTAVALGLWGWREHRAAAELRTPRIDVAAVDLEPAGSDQVRGALAGGPLDLSAGATLFLALPGSDASGELEVSVVDGAGKERWSRAGARRHPDLGNVTLHLPPRSLLPGSYEIRIAAAGGGPLLASYPIDVL